MVLFDDLDGRIGKITLNDPEKLNAMNEKMAAEFSSLTDSLKIRSDLRVLILTGAGRAFSAGGDLKMLEEKKKLSRTENKKKMLEYYNSFLKILELNIPVIAAINGHAVGAGLCLACAADIRICSKDAKLGLTFTKLGLHPGMGVTATLPKIVGAAEAARLMLTGRVIAADEALRIGLVSDSVAADEVLPTALKTAEEIAATGPLATRQLVETLRGEDLSRALCREAECQSENYAGEEFSEGLQAVIERRKPNFSNNG